MSILLEIAPTELREGYGSLIFMGLFFIGVMVLVIWWLKR
jgi:hypothetical protein